MPTITTFITGTTLEAELAALVERLRRSVVIVRDGGRGDGSGVIWSADGTIVTNHHVASGPRAEVVLADGRSYTGQVRLSDPGRDLAVIDVPATGLPAATIGDSDRLRVGELVFAVGNPLGFTGAVTAGIVSGIGERHRRGRRHGERLIQADITLAPGNSGGMLATADGAVVGINAMFRTPGMGLAVPSNAVSALLSSEGAGRAFLGVTLMPIALPAAWAMRPGSRDEAMGLMITSVAVEGPAAQVGLLPGDVIVTLDGEPLASPDELVRELAATRPGEAVVLGLRRGGVGITISIVTGATGRALQAAA